MVAEPALHRALCCGPARTAASRRCAGVEAGPFDPGLPARERGAWGTGGANACARPRGAAVRRYTHDRLGDAQRSGASVAEAQHVAVEQAQELHLADIQLHRTKVPLKDAQVGTLDGALILSAVAGDAPAPC